ncbi:MAG: hypothetical protein K2K53_11475 [Oscillospiraceae bacterium]|nr:hypothetical protein [Oscillospiraceae bacterium]
MASNMIEVNTASLKGDVEEIAVELDEISRDAEKLQGLLEHLESMWDGSAKQAFSAAVKDDLGRLRTLAQAMRQLTSRTSEARAEYDKCESAVAQIVSSIKV